MSSAFFDKMFPYAKKAASALDIPVDVILAQWAVESGYGTSRIAQGGNMAGITHVASSIDGGNDPYQSKSSGLWFAQYGGDLDLFTADYIRVMKLKYYDAVRAAVSSTDTIKALASSPYDAGHYGGSGDSLKKIIDSYNLSKYNDTSIGSGGTQTKMFAVNVAKDATPIMIGAAIIALGLSMINAIAD